MVIAPGAALVLLSALATRSAGRIGFVNEYLGELPSEIEAALYYCCLEAVQNATKHAGPAATISIRLGLASGQARLQIADDGPGVEPRAGRRGVGLRNMHDRLGAVRGRVEIRSTRPQGTTVTAWVPLAR